MQQAHSLRARAASGSAGSRGSRALRPAARHTSTAATAGPRSRLPLAFRCTLCSARAGRGRLRCGARGSSFRQGSINM